MPTSTPSLAPRFVRLPGARLFADPRALRAWLDDHGIGARAGSPVQIESLKLRPARRLTVRLRVGRAIYYAKLYRPERARSVAEKYRKLTRLLGHVRGLKLPALVAADPGRGILVWESIAGRGLPARRPALRRFGRILARVHATRLAHHRIWTPADERRVLVAKLADAPPQARRLARAIGARLSAGSRARTVHRDLYAEQVLLGRGRSAPITILDWDDATLGPPALDVGNLLAHLELAALRSSRPTRTWPGVREAFLRGYREVGAAEEDSWRVWEAASLLRLAGLAWSRHVGRDPVRRGPRSRPPGSPDVEAKLLAGLAEERLAGSRRW